MAHAGRTEVAPYLAPDEPVDGVHSATLLDDAYRGPVTVALTDRRLLCVGADGSYVDVGYDHVCSVRSRTRSELSYRGDDGALALLGGGVLALFAFAGVLVLASNPLVPVLALLAVSGLAAAEGARRGGAVLVWPNAAERLPWPGDRAGLVESRRRIERRLAGAVPDEISSLGRDRAAIGAGGALAAVAFAGVVLLAADVLAPLLVATTVSGLAVADYGYRNRGDGEEPVVDRRRGREVTIDTAGGRVVELRVDPGEEIHRAIGRRVYAGQPETDRVRPTP